MDDHRERMKRNDIKKCEMKKSKKSDCGGRSFFLCHHKESKNGMDERVVENGTKRVGNKKRKKKKKRI